MIKLLISHSHLDLTGLHPLKSNNQHCAATLKSNNQRCQHNAEKNLQDPTDKDHSGPFF
jgi:hypothetical protein